jgi:hypothetical protein
MSRLQLAIYMISHRRQRLVAPTCTSRTSKPESAHSVWTDESMPSTQVAYKKGDGRAPLSHSTLRSQRGSDPTVMGSPGSTDKGHLSVANAELLNSTAGLPARVQIPVPPSAASRLLYELLGRVRLGFLVVSPFRIACKFLHWERGQSSTQEWRTHRITIFKPSRLREQGDEDEHGVSHGYAPYYSRGRTGTLVRLSAPAAGQWHPEERKYQQHCRACGGIPTADH